MNIGIDASCWINRRGHGRYTRELTRALVAADTAHEFWLFVDVSTARQCESLPGGARVRVVEIPTSKPAAEAASAHGHRSWRDLWSIRQGIGRYARRLDVLFFPSVLTYVPVPRSTIVVTLHDTLTEDFPHLMFPGVRNRLLWDAKTRLALRQSRLVFTVSEHARRHVTRRFRLHPERIAVVPDGVSPRFNPARAHQAHGGDGSPCSVPADGRYVLYVGGLSPHKNLSVLIDAFARVARQPELTDLRLLLVGPIEHDSFYSCADELRRQVAARGLGDRVVFTGFVSDDELVHLYGRAQLLVVASLDEGFGLTAAEAMACGTPVLASRVGALHEVVGSAGRFFDPYRADELAHELAAMLADSEGARELGKRGTERARHYTWDTSARRALAAFEGLAPAPGAYGVSA